MSMGIEGFSYGKSTSGNWERKHCFYPLGSMKRLRESTAERLGSQSIVPGCYSKKQNEINSRMPLISGFLIRRANHVVL